jgi:PAS domain S-box-containing protein
MSRNPENKRPRLPLGPSQDGLRMLLRHSPVAAFFATPEGRIVGINAAGSRLLAYTQKDLHGRQIKEICTDPHEWELIERRMQKGGSVRDAHIHLRTKGGSQVQCLVAVKSIDRHGEKKARLFFLWDFTTYAEKIRELESAGERHHLFANMEKDSLWTTEFDRDKNLRVTYMSEPIANIMGYTAREIKDMSLEQMVMPSSAKTAAESYERQLRIDGKKGVDPSRSWSIEFELRHKNGHPVWVEAKSTFMRDRHGKPIGIIGFTRDVTERRRYETQLKALSSSLVEMQEMERRHIARELHDQIGQSLTGIRMLLGMLPEHLPQNAGKIVGEIQTVIDDMVNRVKDLCLELRPSTLDDLGLLPTLLRHFQTYKTQTNLDVHFKQKGLEKRFDPAIETAVFRIVQEGLTNVARHAKVSEVDVRIVVTKNKVRIQIDDGGRGFAREAVYASGTASGIVGMRERAALLGGHLSVESAPGIGTRVAAEIPLKNSPEASAAR